MTFLRRLLCILLGGHERYRYHEPRRMALKCVLCGHETTGWEIGEP